VTADDAVSVLDAAATQRACVYGSSLGGMIAQEIALRDRGRDGAPPTGSCSTVPS
jgi:pimeloyl-ACP methyl ester carboxylesterase